jgi:hypothetical protein
MNHIEELEPAQIEDLERVAYLMGDNERAALLGMIVELKQELLDLQYKLDDYPSEKQMNQEAQDLQHLKEFFYECFQRLDGHYPCPEFSSDYDKGVIFEAIERGEEVKE